MPDSDDRAKRASPVQRLDLLVEDPATLRRPGNFNYDRESGKDPHEWANVAEFDAWRRAEELAYSVELIAATVAHERRYARNGAITYVPTSLSGGYLTVGGWRQSHQRRGLPDKDIIAPNQKTWTEMAARMAIKWAPKQKRLPGARADERCIGVPKGKRCRLHK